MERISSRQNSVVRRFRRLARSLDRDDEALLDGAHLIADALDAGVPIDVIAIAEERAGEALAALVRRAALAGARTIAVSSRVLEVISPVHQPSGIVAIARCGPTELERVLARAPQLVVVLGGVQDPGNVGAIVRVSEACGATGVLTSAGTADPFGWKALRGSMGSAFRMPIAVLTSIDEATLAVSRRGLRVFATVPRGGTPLPAADLRGPAAILLGGEGGGLEPAVIASAHERLTIPMQPPVESLNVATAAALILYEAARQRPAR